MKQVRKFVGLDVHKDTIAVAVSEADRGRLGTMVKFSTRPRRSPSWSRP